MVIGLKELRKKAVDEGKTVDEVISELLKQEEENQEKTLKVQIMPFHNIAGYGSFPSVVDMAEEKALDLARYGKVHIINDDSDIISENDEEAINALQTETLAIRRSKEKGNRPVYSHLVNRKSGESKVGGLSSLKEMIIEEEAEGGGIVEQRPNRGSRRTMQRK